MPQNWKTYKLGEICSRIFSGGTPNTSIEEYWDGDIPWLSSGETRSRYINSTEKTITKFGLEKSSARIAPKGSIVIASAGQGKTRGQTSYLNIETSINQSVLCIEADPKIVDSKYLYYVLSDRYDEFRNISDSYSTRGSLTGDLIKNQISISLPPLPAQRAIASILSALDDKIELNLQMNKTLEEMAMALYKHWFVDFGPFKDGKFVESELGMIPEGWEVKSLKMVCNRIYSGGTPNTSIPEFWNGNLKWLSSGETGNKYIIDTDKRISELGLEKSSTRLANKYSIVMASAGQGKTRGQTSLLLTDTFINQSVLCIEPNEKLAHFTLLYFFLAGQYDFLRHISDSSSTRGSLTTGLLGEQLKLVLPNVSLQSKFIIQTSEFINQIENNLKENEILNSQRDSLLPKLISGEIEIKNIDHEAIL